MHRPYAASLLSCRKYCANPSYSTVIFYWKACYPFHSRPSLQRIPFGDLIASFWALWGHSPHNTGRLPCNWEGLACRIRSCRASPWRRRRPGWWKHRSRRASSRLSWGKWCCLSRWFSWWREWTRRRGKLSKRPRWSGTSFWKCLCRRAWWRSWRFGSSLARTSFHFPKTASLTR